MARLVGTVGAGITQLGIVQFDSEIEISDVLEAAKRTMARERFSLLSRDIIEVATNELEAANLPTDVNAKYQHYPDGWGPIEGPKCTPGTYESFMEVLHNFDVQFDSPRGYAARALMLVDKVQILRAQGMDDEALAAAFELGEIAREAGLKANWEEDALRGEKFPGYGKKGTEIRHGSPEVRRTWRLALVREVQELQAQGLPKTRAKQIVAKKHVVSLRTIQRFLTESQKLGTVEATVPKQCAPVCIRKRVNAGERGAHKEITIVRG